MEFWSRFFSGRGALGGPFNGPVFRGSMWTNGPGPACGGTARRGAFLGALPRPAPVLQRLQLAEFRPGPSPTYAIRPGPAPARRFRPANIGKSGKEDNRIMAVPRTRRQAGQAPGPRRARSARFARSIRAGQVSRAGVHRGLRPPVPGIRCRAVSGRVEPRHSRLEGSSREGDFWQPPASRPDGDLGMSSKGGGRSRRSVIPGRPEAARNP